jgi:hypothetical protein
MFQPLCFRFGNTCRLRRKLRWIRSPGITGKSTSSVRRVSNIDRVSWWVSFVPFFSFLRRILQQKSSSKTFFFDDNNKAPRNQIIVINSFNNKRELSSLSMNKPRRQRSGDKHNVASRRKYIVGQISFLVSFEGGIVRRRDRSSFENQNHRGI